MRELTEIPIEKLEKESIAQADVYYNLPRNNKFVKIIQTGDLITEDYIYSFKKQGINSLFLSSSGNISFRNKLFELLNTLSELIFDDEKDEVRKLILKLTEEVYSVNAIAVSIFDFIWPFYKKFFDLSKSLLINMKDTSVDRYYLSLELSAFSTFFLLVLGYLDTSFLRNIYNTSFLLNWTDVDDFRDENLTKEIEKNLVLETLMNQEKNFYDGIKYDWEILPSFLKNHLIANDINELILLKNYIFEDRYISSKLKSVFEKHG